MVSYRAIDLISPDVTIRRSPGGVVLLRHGERRTGPLAQHV